MADKTGIEWAEATWNPATGCTKVSTGCKYCYAERITKRLIKLRQPKYYNGFKYTEHENEIDKPLSWKKPRRIFVNSMSDLFHEDATDSFIDAVFKTMIRADQHQYLILTKRPERMAEFVKSWFNKEGSFNELPKHIWLGVSVETQQYVTRIDILRYIPCTIHFVSFEPLLGPIIHVNFQNIQWAIVGGESGSNHRPIEEWWVEDLHRQCRRSQVPFFFKQWGGITSSANGRTLNGKIYDEYPSVNNVRGLQTIL